MSLYTHTRSSKTYRCRVQEYWERSFQYWNLSNLIFLKAITEIGYTYALTETIDTPKFSSIVLSNANRMCFIQDQNKTNVTFISYLI